MRFVEIFNFLFVLEKQAVFCDLSQFESPENKYNGYTSKHKDYFLEILAQFTEQLRSSSSNQKKFECNPCIGLGAVPQKLIVIAQLSVIWNIP